MHTLERKPALIKPSPAAEAFYSEVLQLMAKSEIPFLVSGTYALASYTGIDRPTKDVDVFAKAGDALKLLSFLQGARLRRRDRRRALARRGLRAANCSSTSSPTCRR